MSHPPAVAGTQPQATNVSKTSLAGHNSFIDVHIDAPSPSRPTTQSMNAKLANPLAGLSHEQIMADAADFARTHELAEYTEVIQKGALVAQDPAAFESLPTLNEDDRRVLRREFTHKWDQPKMLYYLAIMCSIAAAVQGVRVLPSSNNCCIYSHGWVQMDEAVVNGANLFFPRQFGIDPGNNATSGSNRNEWLVGLVTSAPYVRPFSTLTTAYVHPS